MEEGGKMQLFQQLWGVSMPNISNGSSPNQDRASPCAVFGAELLLQGQEGQGSHGPCDFSCPVGKTPEITPHLIWALGVEAVCLQMGRF